MYLPNDVTTLARQKGKLFVAGGIDYLSVANNKFPWQHIPDLVIARNGYDNFVVATAIENNVPVVDATSTLLAVHQTGTHALRRRHVNKLLISKLIRTRVGFTIRVGKYLKRGYVDQSPDLTTNINQDDTVIVTVIKRPPQFVRRESPNSINYTTTALPVNTTTSGRRQNDVVLVGNTSASVGDVAAVHPWT